jgi:hypothetical protein
MLNPTSDKVSKPTKPRIKNALTHGIYGKDILLPWESRKDFEKLLVDLRDELRPNGRLENDIVFDIAHLRWQKYRIHQMYTAAAYCDPFVRDLVKARQKSWKGMARHLRRTSEQERTMLDLQTKIFMEQTEKVAETLANALRDGKWSNSGIAHGNGYLDVGENFTMPLIEAFEARPSAGDLLGRTYSTEHLEPVIRLEAMIDARIDKALARLVNLKEYKRMVAARSVGEVGRN